VLSVKGGVDDITAWMARWGFAILVSVATVAGLIAGATVTVPAGVPGFALQSTAVYRLEVGAAIFLGLYFVAMAFVLALRNRAFTEISTDGIRAESLGELPRALLTQERALGVLSEMVDEIGSLRDEREGR
jgi:hypothetical protein